MAYYEFMKAVILARVSTEEQKDAGNSLPAQIQRMQDYCYKKGIEVSAEFSFDESAYKTKRDELDAILEHVYASEEKVAVCFDKVDRFSRNVFDKRVAKIYELAMEDKIELHFASDNLVINSNISAVEKFHFGINLGLAKYYSDAISDNTRRAFEQKRRAGEWTGPVRIGYKNVSLDVSKRLRKDIVPDPERAHLIQRLFELYATGNYSITTLWQEMTKLGLRGQNGQVLARSNIDLILNDTFYFGMAKSPKYGSFAHRYQCLITRELYDQCQLVRTSRRKRPSTETTKPFIFKGLLNCQNCGCLMSPEIKKGKFIYYSCTNSKGTCKREYVPEKTLLGPIHDVFKAFAGIPVEVQERLVSELRIVNEGEIEFHRREIDRMQAEYNRIQTRIDTLLDMRLESRITPDDYDKKLQKLKDEQYKLDVDLRMLTKADHEYHIHVSTILSLSRRIGEIFESSELPEKRAILNYILQNPTVSGRTLKFELKKPFNTVLELGLSLSQSGKRDSNESLSPVWLRG